MHARELVDLAAIVSAHGPVLIRSADSISTSRLETYWTASKVRLDRWARRLKQFSAIADDVRRDGGQWPEVRGVLEEILASEILTRVWTAVLCAYDRGHGADDAEPVARSVLIGHMEARHRVLTFLVGAAGVEVEAAARLDRLRRRAEGWTDLLVGHLAVMHGVSEFAFDPGRARDFAEDWRHRGGLRDSRQTWPLILGSMRTAFGRLLRPKSANGELNAQVAASILACFPAEGFDSTGLLRSLWLVRLATTVGDSRGAIEDLFPLDGPTTAARPARTRLWRRMKDEG